MRGLLEPFLMRRLKETVASQLVAKQQQVCIETLGFRLDMDLN